ncbi:MAG: SEC-C domain-containing protein [Planctomycetes bacterium]|nr:SEC-C domain-containing protein [Planctomycetota bacterium]
MKYARNDPCWCGSGLKFKKCHLDREGQARPSRQDVLKRFRALQTRSRCYHPEASGDRCSQGAVNAHTVPRAMLERIARDGHVYAFPRSLG